MCQGLGIRELHSWDPLLPPGLLKCGDIERKDFILGVPLPFFSSSTKGKVRLLHLPRTGPSLGQSMFGSLAGPYGRREWALMTIPLVRTVHKKAPERMQKGWRRQDCPAPLSQKVVTSSLWNSTPSWPWGQTEGFSGTLRRGGLLSRPSVFSVIILSQRPPSSCITSQRGH